TDQAPQRSPSVAASDRGRIFLPVVPCRHGSNAAGRLLLRRTAVTISACFVLTGSPMEIRNLGGSGLRVSAVGLGCNTSGQPFASEPRRRVTPGASVLGITLFDPADFYSTRGGSKTVLGTVPGARRKDIVLAMKYSKPMTEDGTKQGASRRYIMDA